MNKSIFVGDVHIGKHLWYIGELAKDNERLLERAFQVAIKKKVDTIYILGDLFDTKKPHAQHIQFVADLVKNAYKKHGITTFGIQGDHEWSSEASWLKIAGIDHPRDEEVVGFDYNLDPNITLQAIKDLPNKEVIECILLHGQTENYTYAEEKKLFRLSEVDWSEFPNLKAIVMGDLHAGVNSSGFVGKERIPIIYTGSLGVCGIDEVEKDGILYFDGTSFTRLPFETERDYVTMDLALITPAKVEELAAKKYAVKPVFIVDTGASKDIQADLVKILPLYKIGVVRRISTKINEETGKKEVINIRTDLPIQERIEMALREACGDDELFNITLSLLNAVDPSIVLDEFKEQSNED